MLMLLLMLESPGWCFAGSWIAHQIAHQKHGAPFSFGALHGGCVQLQGCCASDNPSRFNKCLVCFVLAFPVCMYYNFTSSWQSPECKVSGDSSVKHKNVSLKIYYKPDCAFCPFSLSCPTVCNNTSKWKMLTSQIQTSRTNKCISQALCWGAQGFFFNAKSKAKTTRTGGFSTRFGAIKSKTFQRRLKSFSRSGLLHTVGKNKW